MSPDRPDRAEIDAPDWDNSRAARCRRCSWEFVRGDPPTMLAAAVVCFATVLLGCLRPGARAARVDPMSALRGG
jgi:hypothetical protein